MPKSERGSLTKEPPLSRIDATAQLIIPGMRYDALLQEARNEAGRQPTDRAPHSDAPGLLRKRFLIVNAEGEIEYDHLLSLIATHGIDSSLVRRVLYFVWAWRDDRIRRFIVEQVADASGRWSYARITDKNRWRFFSQYTTTDDSAKKARSNYEFFLTEAGILAEGSVQLRPVDGWLREAMRVAAQHEPDPAVRARMRTDPIGTLFDLNLNALADLTLGDRGVAALTGPDVENVEAEADDEEKLPATWDVKDWEDRNPGTAAPGKDTVVLTNPVAQERARASHLMLERLLATALAGSGRNAQYTNAIDMLSTTPDTIIAEIKSCTARTFHSQVRRGVSQLLEYRWTHRANIPAEAILVLLVETAPPARKRWLIEYLRSLDIYLVWKEHRSDRLVMTGQRLPAALKELFAIV